jgi:hypothetical protein
MRIRPAVGSMSRLIIFIVVVFAAARRPDQDRELARGEREVELGHATVPSGKTLLTPSSRISSAVPGPAGSVAVRRAAQ